MALTSADEIVSSKLLGAVLGLTERRVQQLEAESVFHNVGAGRSKRYRLSSAVQAYTEYKVKSEIDARIADQPSRSDYDFERARKLKLANDQQEAQLQDTELVIAAVDLIVGMLRTDLAGVPARITEDVALRRRAEDAIDTVLGGLSARFAKARDALRAGRDPVEADEADAA